MVFKPYYLFKYNKKYPVALQVNFFLHPKRKLFITTEDKIDIECHQNPPKNTYFYLILKEHREAKFFTPLNYRPKRMVKVNAVAVKKCRRN